MEGIITVIERVGTTNIDIAEQELLSYAEKSLSEEKKQKLQETLKDIREKIDAFKKNIGMLFQGFFKNMLEDEENSEDWDNPEDPQEFDTIDHEEL